MWTLLPLKKLSNAKQRLSALLTPYERRYLFCAMVEDVLETLKAHPLVEGVVLVSDDPYGQLLAERYDTRLYQESELARGGLNGAVECTIAKLAAEGINEIMVLHGDLPLISSEEITELIHRHLCQQQPAVTIATDVCGRGSNGVLCSPANKMRFHYGENSLNKHQQQATSMGASFQSVALPGIGRDIDEPVDLQILMQCLNGDRARHTARFLEQSGLAVRLDNNNLTSNQLISNLAVNY